MRDATRLVVKYRKALQIQTRSPYLCIKATHSLQPLLLVTAFEQRLSTLRLYKTSDKSKD